MAVFLLVLAFAAIIAREVPKLWQERMWRELVAFFVLVISGIFLSFGLVFNWPLPNPTSWLESVFKPFSKFLVNS